MVRTNLIAPMVLTRATLRHLEASRGYVVNIASTAALNPGPFGAAYGATKAGLHQFGQALFSEVRKSGVRVVTLYPDMTRTPFYDHADFEPGEDPGRPHHARMRGRRHRAGRGPAGGHGDHADRPTAAADAG